MNSVYGVMKITITPTGVDRRAAGSGCSFWGTI
jgi:hypothetical protein